MWSSADVCQTSAKPYVEVLELFFVFSKMSLLAGITLKHVLLNYCFTCLFIVRI